MVTTVKVISSEEFYIWGYVPFHNLKRIFRCRC